MPRRHLRVLADGGDLRAALAALRTELDVPAEFPSTVLAEAEAAARNPVLPDRDATDLPLITIDPPGARDLDQALHLERRGAGYRVSYAIADVAAFIRPGGALDEEAHRRGETLYAPDLRVPLHPPVLSEGAASLLPGEVRPAVLWTLDLDSSGEEVGVDVARALVRSREQLDYPGVQSALDTGRAPEPLTLLREVGLLRAERERDRGGVSLPIPEQVAVPDGSSWRLEFRAPLPVEGWNAQVSLLTGMSAAQLMLYGEVGVLRTLPAAPAGDLERLRRVALGLGIDWALDMSYAEVVRTRDAHDPQDAAFLEEATELLRGAGYTAFDGGVPEQATHAGVAGEYTHVTAPLRRLVDRYASEVCLALVADEKVPDWVRDALPGLPSTMAGADRRASGLERATLDLLEAAVLRPMVGSVLDAVVIDAYDRGGGEVQVRDPAVRARCDGDRPLPLGERLRVRLVEADPRTRRVRFAPA